MQAGLAGARGCARWVGSGPPGVWPGTAGIAEAQRWRWAAWRAETANLPATV